MKEDELFLLLLHIELLDRVATVLENPGKSWNWGKKIPGPGKLLNLGRGP